MNRTKDKGWKNGKYRTQCKNHEANPADRAAQERAREILAERAKEPPPDPDS